MLLVNLLPPEQRESIDEHPFFRALLAISGPGGNPIVGKIAESDLASQAAFLTTAAKAHAALLIAAPLAYRRVAELSVSTEARQAAQKAFDLEIGRDDVSQLERFMRMVESLLPGLELARPDADDFALHRSLKINQASLSEAFALCEELERARSGATLAWQDFVSQWQVFLGIRTEKLDRQFLGERELVGELLGLCPELRAKPEHAQAREKVRHEFVSHLDQATREILSRLE
jgi:hypothetical protein